MNSTVRLHSTNGATITLKSTARIITVSLLTLALTCLAFAQRRPSRTSPPAKPSPSPSPVTEKPTIEKKPVASSYSREPFDASLASLSPGFRGNSVIEIYDSLAERKKASVKGEFETTEAYNQRLRTDMSKPLIGSLTQDNVFAFAINGIGSEYDADRRVLHVRADVPRYPFNKDWVIYRWGTVETGNSSYVATNAFGAQITVKRRRGRNYEIFIDNHQRFPTSTYVDEVGRGMSDEEKNRYPELFEIHKKQAFVADLDLPADDALRAKTNLRLLLVCRLAAPYMLEGEDLDSFSRPTFDLPFDTQFTFHRLYVDLVELWFYDFATGEVFARTKPR